MRTDDEKLARGMSSGKDYCKIKGARLTRKSMSQTISGGRRPTWSSDALAKQQLFDHKVTTRGLTIPRYDQNPVCYFEGTINSEARTSFYFLRHRASERVVAFMQHDGQSISENNTISAIISGADVLSSIVNGRIVFVLNVPTEKKIAQIDQCFQWAQKWFGPSLHHSFPHFSMTMCWVDNNDRCAKWHGRASIVCDFVEFQTFDTEINEAEVWVNRNN